MSKEEIEQNLIEKFCKLYGKFSMEQISRGVPPNPDFILDTGAGKTIGIEVTQIFSDDQILPRIRLEEDLMREILDAISGKLPFTFILSIDFDKKKRNRKRWSKIILEVCNFILSEVPKLFSNKIAEFTNVDKPDVEFDPYITRTLNSIGYYYLPEGVERIRIIRENMEKSMISKSGTIFSRRLLTDAIQDCVIDKEEKISGYGVHDEKWLVIQEGRNILTDFYHDDEYPTLETDFNKVFLLRYQKNQLIVLK